MIVGWERFRFTQSRRLGNNSHAAFMGGGGVDYKIGNGRLYWRVQADFMGTNIGPPSFSKNYFVGTGLSCQLLKEAAILFSTAGI